MEIVNGNCATLCNYEVLKHLQKIKDSRVKKGQLATITYETIHYLENTPCKEVTPENIKQCLRDLAQYNLNKMELLTLVNNPPSTALEIQLIIEESEERLTNEQVDEILKIVAKHFPHAVKQDEAQEEMEDNE